MFSLLRCNLVSGSWINILFYSIHLKYTLLSLREHRIHSMINSHRIRSWSSCWLRPKQKGDWRHVYRSALSVRSSEVNPTERDFIAEIISTNLLLCCCVCLPQTSTGRNAQIANPTIRLIEMINRKFWFRQWALWSASSSSSNIHKR